MTKETTRERKGGGREGEREERCKQKKQNEDNVQETSTDGRNEHKGKMTKEETSKGNRANGRIWEGRRKMRKLTNDSRDGAKK